MGNDYYVDVITTRGHASKFTKMIVEETYMKIPPSVYSKVNSKTMFEHYPSQKEIDTARKLLTEHKSIF